MKIFFRSLLAVLSLSAPLVVLSQQPEAVLRFDAVQREELTDEAALFSVADTTIVATLPFACKLNRRRATEAEVYDAVTLWNVRRVRVKNRRMRLSDTTRREKVRLLKFFIECNRKKGVRPHLLGNVAGYRWSSFVRENGRWHEAPPSIGAYVLRQEIDSLCATLGGRMPTHVPDELWHELPRSVRYVLDGTAVHGALFQFIDGLILRTLDIVRDATDDGRPLVVGTTYPIGCRWLFSMALLPISAHGSTCVPPIFFSFTSEVPMRYYYMLPLEAVECFGPRGLYGAICVETL